jgi:hypothetical protein
VGFTITPIKDETGKLIGMAAVMRDVTKQFQEMRELKRMSAPRTLDQISPPKLRNLALSAIDSSRSRLR